MREQESVDREADGEDPRPPSGKGATVIAVLALVLLVILIATNMNYARIPARLQVIAASAGNARTMVDTMPTRGVASDLEEERAHEQSHHRCAECLWSATPVSALWSSADRSCHRCRSDRAVSQVWGTDSGFQSESAQVVQASQVV